MKLELSAQIHSTRHIHLGNRAKEAILAAFGTLLPYAIAALGVFAYHEQWFK